MREEGERRGGDQDGWINKAEREERVGKWQWESVIYRLTGH